MIIFIKHYLTFTVVPDIEYCTILTYYGSVQHFALSQAYFWPLFDEKIYSFRTSIPYRALFLIREMRFIKYSYSLGRLAEFFIKIQWYLYLNTAVLPSC